MIDELPAVDASAIGALADVEHLVSSSGGQLSRVGLGAVGELELQIHAQRAVLLDGAGLPEVRNQRVRG